MSRASKPIEESSRAQSYKFGPVLDQTGCLFQLWARGDARVELVVENGSAPVAMQRNARGIFETRVEGVGAGARYWFTIDGAGPFPDPASRYQPEGVHGPSQVVDAASYRWKPHQWAAPRLRELAIYELHVGTFTPAGTFAGVAGKLEQLRELGVNTIELLPVAEFGGAYNWGYDGVSLYAPSHTYGTPDDLRRLVEAAHEHGIAVCLDVVYNHLGPDGAYHSTFAPQFYSGRHKTPWGDGLNFDGEGRENVRDYFIQSALMWLRDYRVDGLRCDATHAIQDDSQPHFLAELTERVHAEARTLSRDVFIIAEDERNDRRLVTPAAKGGYGFDAVWSDDFHHHMRRRLAGDSDGYFRDFDGKAASIARTVQDGWFFDGQYAAHKGGGRGTSPAGLTSESRVFCIQNHDQIGNRAFGERLSTQISRTAYLTASALLLLSPEIPLLFMGQEWAASSPFLYFTSHNAELGRLVTEGRRKEFEHFAAFADEQRREEIPDPQAEETFLRSRIDWQERESGDHAKCLEWYRTLLHIRASLLKRARFAGSSPLGDGAVLVEWISANGRLVLATAFESATPALKEPAELRLALSSEDTRFLDGPQEIEWNAGDGTLGFHRAGAALLASGDLESIVSGGKQ